MYRHKLTHTKTHSENARRLQNLLISYHDFRSSRDQHPLATQVLAIGRWQAARLKRSHQDRYADARYRTALDFLLEDLYAPQTFTRRDDDLDRIFPTLVRLLPDSVLYTLAELIELNLVSQQLDRTLTEQLGADFTAETLSEASYCRAYRACNNGETRLRQIQLVANIGDDLQGYVRSRSLAFALNMTEGAAEMAGLGDLHRFLRRGFAAFRTMGQVDELLSVIVQRETRYHQRLMDGNDAAYSDPASDPA